MSSKDSHLYNPKTHNLSNGKAISSSTTLAFTSQLSCLINTSNSTTTSKTSSRLKPKKDDLFHRAKGNSAKRAKYDHSDSPAFEQKHTTDGENLDPKIWERSRRRMEEKARLYAAMKRGDVEDDDEKYAVDFDRKWAEKHPEGDVEESDDDAGSEEDVEMVEYTDEFGRTRKGTRADMARIQRAANARADLGGDRFTARPSAPANVIYGDTVQHEAFNPDAQIADAMDELAKKRDRSLTPPPDAHFDASKEVRSKGTGFFQFSGDAAERAWQMEGLEQERVETEKRRKERQEKLDERKKQIEERRKQLQSKRGKRMAEDFLDELGLELGDKVGPATGTDVTERIDAAIAREKDDGGEDVGD